MMKRMIQRLFVITAMTLLSVHANGQDHYDFDQSIVVGDRSLLQEEKDPHLLTSNFSLSFTPIGLEIGYEQRIGRYWTITPRFGMASTAAGDLQDAVNYRKRAFIDLTFNDGHHLIMQSFPTLSFETRYYATLARRIEKGRNTYMNSANFISLKGSMSYLLRDDNTVSMELLAQYGIRRMLGKSFFVEPTVGLNFAFITKDLFPTLNIRMGVCY